VTVAGNDKELARSSKHKPLAAASWSSTRPDQSLYRAGEARPVRPHRAPGGPLPARLGRADAGVHFSAEYTGIRQQMRRLSASTASRESLP